MAHWGSFFMFFANNFFLKIGNLSIETEFRCKNLQRYVFHLVSYSINIQYLYFLQKFLEISTKNDSFEKKWYLQPSYDPN